MPDSEDRTDADLTFLILQNCHDLGVGDGPAQAMVERVLKNRRMARAPKTAVE